MTFNRLFPQTLKNHYHRLQAMAAVLRYGYPARKLVVIGVTGTDGKTTTASLIYHLLKTAGYKVACLTTVGAYLGDEFIETGLHTTTPDPWQLQKLIRRMADQGITHLVLEVTSHALDQYRVWGIPVAVALVTNVSHEHLDYHHNFKEYLKAKAKIFRSAKTIVLNAEDPSYPELKDLIPPGRRLLSFSLKSAVPAMAVIHVRFPERYNQANALAAVTLCRTFDLKPEVIDQAIKTFPGVTGRQAEIPNRKGLKIVVDFAHTPNGLRQALTALKQSTSGKLIAVYGAAGQRDVTKRPLMGQFGSELADEVVLTSEDPRSEPVESIIRQIKEGVKHHHGHVHAIVDRQEAINFAINTLAHPGDTVGIFGKGHERSINLDGRHELPWSDEAAVKQALGSDSV